MGLQAWQNRLLKSIGRIHSAEDFMENFNLARKVGFKNINIDLIFGLPGQSINDWQATHDNIIRQNPEHISCYSLKIEEGTVFGERYESDS
jgi:oxygen-independent coproporphyrinogen-3 oxidase